MNSLRIWHTNLRCVYFWLRWVYVSVFYFVKYHLMSSACPICVLFLCSHLYAQVKRTVRCILSLTPFSLSIFEKVGCWQHVVPGNITPAQSCVPSGSIVPVTSQHCRCLYHHLAGRICKCALQYFSRDLWEYMSWERMVTAIIADQCSLISPNELA